MKAIREFFYNLKFTKRGTYTIIFWSLYLTMCVGMHFMAISLHGGGSHGLAIFFNIFVTVIFAFFMNRRSYYLDRPYLSTKCRFKWHDTEYTTDSYMEGTGKYIGEQEITRKKFKTHYRCRRTSCDHRGTYY